MTPSEQLTAKVKERTQHYLAAGIAPANATMLAFWDVYGKPEPIEPIGDSWQDRAASDAGVSRWGEI